MGAATRRSDVVDDGHRHGGGRRPADEQRHVSGAPSGPRTGRSSTVNTPPRWRSSFVGAGMAGFGCRRRRDHLRRHRRWDELRDGWANIRALSVEGDRRSDPGRGGCSGGGLQRHEDSSGSGVSRSRTLQTLRRASTSSKRPPAGCASLPAVERGFTHAQPLTDRERATLVSSPRKPHSTAAPQRMSWSRLRHDRPFSRRSSLVVRASGAARHGTNDFAAVADLVVG